MVKQMERDHTKNKKKTWHQPIQRFFRPFPFWSWGARLAFIYFILLNILAIGSPWLTPYSPHIPSAPPLEAPSTAHWLGTDDLGVDLWSQLLFGARSSLMVGSFSALGATILACLVGVMATYYGGWVDRLLMRLVDTLLVLPALPTMIVLGAFFGPSLWHIIFVLVFFTWAGPARIIRARVLSLQAETFVQVARTYGAGIFYLTWRHYLPYLFPLLVVNAIRLMGRAVITEASLSFLGLGDPTSKSWGLTLHHALHFQGIYFTPFWQWWVIAPLVAILSLVLAVAILGHETERKLLKGGV